MMAAVLVESTGAGGTDYSWILAVVSVMVIVSAVELLLNRYKEKKR
ncbi:MAG: hypothetical protein PHI87_04220 [Candidatus Methanomethylophilus sp.]|nr:hypothetical protein [Methanomethylophilus sp.]MDD4221914.1 hypothetical protein [Methanomethylophilus sp.]MDD4668899.1 hypothetical protein [Methanomethylophilus sp.]